MKSGLISLRRSILGRIKLRFYKKTHVVCFSKIQALNGNSFIDRRIRRLILKGRKVRLI